MDGQHSYEINLKKDDLFINLSSDDVYFISKQMDKWFRILLDDSYVPVSLPKPPAPTPLAQEQPAPTQPVQEAPAIPVAPVAPPPAPVAEQPATPQPVPQAQPAPEPTPQAIPQPAPVAEVAPVSPQPAAEPQPQPVPVAPAIPAAQTEIPQPQPAAPQPLPVPVTPQPAAILDQAVQDDFEAVMDTLMQDLEGDDDVPAPASANGNGNGNAHAETPPITSLSELCDRSSAGSSEDYLLLSAYYIAQFEQQEKFSLKRINAMLVKSGLTPVNHSVLESSLTQGYLSMVPDLTGLAEVSEYALTAEGQQAAASLL